jgi:hypothetical protein
MLSSLSLLALVLAFARRLRSFLTASKALGTPTRMAKMASMVPTMTVVLQIEFESTGTGARQAVGIAVDDATEEAKIPVETEGVVSNLALNVDDWRESIGIEGESVELIAGMMKLVCLIEVSRRGVYEI